MSQPAKKTYAKPRITPQGEVAAITLDKVTGPSDAFLLAGDIGSGSGSSNAS